MLFKNKYMFLFLKTFPFIKENDTNVWFSFVFNIQNKFYNKHNSTALFLSSSVLFSPVLCKFMKLLD